MKNSLKGALLSALIFPGIGHLAFKRYRRGIALILITTIGMIVITAEAIRTALTIIEKIEANGVLLSTQTITRITHQAIASSGNALLNAGLFFVAICWICGVIDAYRIGKNLDRQRY